MLPGSTALRYRLLEGRTDVAPLRILATQHFLWGHWRVTAHVLGASHAVQLESENGVFTELLTCAPAPGEHAALLALDAPGLAEASLGVLEVRVRLWRQGLGCRLNASNMTVAFPIGPSEIAPETQLAWEMSAQQLRVTSVHTYPEENTTVWTETVLTEKKAYEPKKF